MSIWDKLESWLGTSSEYYEMLFKSKKESRTFNEADVVALSADLRSILLSSKSYKLTKDKVVNEIKSSLKSWPKYKNKWDIPYFATITGEDFKCNIFLKLDYLGKNKNHVVFDLSLNNTQELNSIASESVEQSSFTVQYNNAKSLPIWEELIHRTPELHKKVVAVAPTQPWSLYKASKKQIASSKLNVTNGYPQWKINDIDYRTISSSRFLFQIHLEISDLIYYVFLDREKQVQVLVQ